MNPLIIQDCEKVLPNPFLLAIAAAARARALRHGAEPKTLCGSLPPTERALQEIAAGFFVGRRFRVSAFPRPRLSRPLGTFICREGRT